jgi:hypothetical protein
VYAYNKKNKETANAYSDGMLQLNAKAGDTVVVYTYNAGKRSTDTVVMQAYMLTPYYATPAYTPVEPIKRNTVQTADSSQYIASADSQHNNLNTSVYKGFMPRSAAVVKKVTIAGNEINVEYQNRRRLQYNVLFTTSASINTANRQPQLQNQYVQGRSINGQLQWRGAETDEPFSYGPAAATLGYDGSNYVYDHKGKLVALTQAKGSLFKPYNNQVLQTGHTLQQLLVLTSKYMIGYKNLLDCKMSYSRKDEVLLLKQNNNQSNRFSFSAISTLQKTRLEAAYSFVADHTTFSNRNGYLNQVYRAALLTPVSFDNNQGYVLPNKRQRSFNSNIDNPNFLLSNTGNASSNVQHIANVTASTMLANQTISLSQHYTSMVEKTPLVMPVGSAAFTAGLASGKQQRHNSYQVMVSTKGNWIPLYNFEVEMNVCYWFNTTSASILYTPTTQNFHYNRNTQEAAASLQASYRIHYSIRLLANLSNNIYHSNTAAKNHLFLPTATAGIILRDAPFDYLKITGQYSYSVKEPNITTSYNYAALSQLPSYEAAQYFPLKEVETYKGLTPVKVKHYNLNLWATWKYGLSFYANYFIRNQYDDVFPVAGSNSVYLINAANHTTKGIELTLTYDVRKYMKKLQTTHELSFSTWKNKVTRVAQGLEGMPVAGFSDVHNTLLTGQPLGIITGSSFLKDEQGNVRIAADGFPIPGNRAIIANPNPRFMLKNHNSFMYKGWRFELTVEWKNGGSMWNGTQAALDYYGRSATTAAERNITGYVFTGVQANGNKNDIPVSFYDPLKPVEQNKWVRYGPVGIAENYVQQTDFVRINNLSVGYLFRLRKTLHSIELTAFANNLFLWNAYKGADPMQSVLDIPAASGLDYFNLPSQKSIGLKLQLTL